MKNVDAFGGPQTVERLIELLEVGLHPSLHLIKNPPDRLLVVRIDEFVVSSPQKKLTDAVGFIPWQKTLQNWSSGFGYTNGRQMQREFPRSSAVQEFQGSWDFLVSGCGPGHDPICFDE